MIQHVTREILPAELDECTSFYGLLGFDPVPAPAGIAGRAVWLERLGTQIHLMFVTAAAATERRPSGHVGVVVDRYPETVDALSAAGHAVEPRTAHWGSPRAYVRDPAGYLVELMAWAPGETGPPRGETGRSHGRKASPPGQTGQ
jgi:catechol 2,3-dioxygenase-like lactoylglutathione lyase family enzyme